MNEDPNNVDVLLAIAGYLRGKMFPMVMGSNLASGFDDIVCNGVHRPKLLSLDFFTVT